MSDLTDQLRALANVVDEIEDADVDVEVQQARLANLSAEDNLLQATLNVLAPTEPEQKHPIDESSVNTDDSADDMKWEDSEALIEEGFHEDAKQDDDDAEQTEANLVHSEPIGPTQSKTDDDETDGDWGANLSDSQRAVQAILKADGGELTSADVRDRADVKPSTVGPALSKLSSMGVAEARPDPTDGRRKLYRIAGAPIDEEASEDDDFEGSDTAAELEADQPHVAPTGVGDTNPLETLDDERDEQGNLDHRNEDHLQAAYDAHDTIKAAADEFEPSYKGIWYRLIEAGIHETRNRQAVGEEELEAARQALDDDEHPERPDWMARDPDEIVDQAAVDATLADILDVIAEADSITGVYPKIGGDARTVQDLLWELGLRKPGGGLLESDDLEERIASIRRCCLDEPELAMEVSG